MPRVLLFISALFLIALNFGCNSASSAPNSEVTASGTPARRANANTSTNTNTIIQPIVNSANLPANSANAPVVGTMPIPGIDPGNAVRTLKPGEKIPGIPDQATVKKQLTTRVDPSKLPPEFRRALNANANANPDMMKANVNASPSMMRKVPANTNASPSMMKKKPTE